MLLKLGSRSRFVVTVDVAAVVVVVVAVVVAVGGLLGNWPQVVSLR